MMGRRHSLFQKVLIGYDGSTQADTATETALALASSVRMAADPTEILNETAARLMQAWSERKNRVSPVEKLVRDFVVQVVQAKVKKLHDSLEALALQLRDDLRNGPEYRRRVNRLAQDFARAQLTPWLDGEGRYAEEEFRKTARRFVELANDFLHRLSEAGISGLEELPGVIGSEQGLRARSQFHFHLIERVALLRLLYCSYPTLFLAFCASSKA